MTQITFSFVGQVQAASKVAVPMTNPERSAETQRRIDEIEEMLERLRPLCDHQLAGHPRPGSPDIHMCRMERLESELKRLKGL